MFNNHGAQQKPSGVYSKLSRVHHNHVHDISPNVSLWTPNHQTRKRNLFFSFYKKKSLVHALTCHYGCFKSNPTLTLNSLNPMHRLSVNPVSHQHSAQQHQILLDADTHIHTHKHSCAHMDRVGSVAGDQMHPPRRTRGYRADTNRF